MPDLDQEAVANWVASFGPPLFDIPDDPQRLAIEADHGCEEAIRKLGTELDRAFDIDPQRLSETLRDPQTRSQLGNVLVRMSLARQARLINWIFNAGVPNGQSLLAQLAAPGAEGIGDAIREGVFAIHRQDLLERIFSKERLAALLYAVRLTETELQQEA